LIDNRWERRSEHWTFILYDRKCIFSLPLWWHWPQQQWRNQGKLGASDWRGEFGGHTNRDIGKATENTKAFG
jgi:hypothetical protein